jgi:hypothetical protein
MSDVATSQETRRDNLAKLAVESMDIYHDGVSVALEGGYVPRYALQTSEGSSESSYRDNPDLSVHDSVDSLAESIASSLEDGWPPLQVVDLDSGEEVGYSVRITIDDEEIPA